jgi:hypothetical protein
MNKKSIVENLKAFNVNFKIELLDLNLALNFDSTIYVILKRGKTNK